MRKQKLYKGKIILTCDDNHNYWANGEKVEYSATGVTSIIDKSSPLMGWVAKLMSLYLLERLKERPIDEETIRLAQKEYRTVSQREADIGTAIHEWIESWIKGENPEIPNDERIANGIISFLKWQKEVKARFNKKDSERLVYSRKYGYAGTLDAIATIKKKKVIIDFKSSRDIYNEYRYQLAAYWQAYEEENGKTFDHGLIIRFDKETGQFDPDKNILEISRDEYEKDIKAFLGALEVKKREKELNIKK